MKRANIETAVRLEKQLKKLESEYGDITISQFITFGRHSQREIKTIAFDETKFKEPLSILKEEIRKIMKAEIEELEKELETL